MKSSHRRALAAALGSHRCPTCNRSGGLGVFSTRPRPLLACSCGAFYAAEIETTERPTRSGYRVVATLTGLTAVTG